MTEQEFIDNAARDQAARVMLAALNEIAVLFDRGGTDMPDLAAIARAAIAQAEAAGIEERAK